MDAKRARDEQGSEPERLDEAERRAAVRALMGRIAEGEDDAIWELHELAEGDLARIIRAEARRLDLRLEAEEVWELTLDAVDALADVAGAWQPDGSWPWVWAHHRVRAVVHAHIGTFASRLDDAHLDLESPPPVERIEDPLVVLRRAAERHPAARELEHRLRRVAERDAAIYLGVALERAAGNRAPAVTVGADHGLQPPAVRKVVQRVGQKLAEVA
ncbi:MAG: hypothetical protein ACLGI8_07270 [Acidimicrobiia bacterium]